MKRRGPGEHGRGFAVVADEVRGLAARTALGDRRGRGDGCRYPAAYGASGGADPPSCPATSIPASTQVEHTGQHLETSPAWPPVWKVRSGEIARGAETNREQLDSLFHAIEQMRSDLAISDQQTQRLAQAAVQMEGQAETISERLAEVGLDDYHQRIYDLAREGASQIAARFEADIEQATDQPRRPVRPPISADSPNTSPQIPRPAFDRYTDQVLPAIQEPLLPRHEGLVFAIACTQQGYVPTHNQAFSSTADLATRSAVHPA